MKKILFGLLISSCLLAGCAAQAPGPQHDIPFSQEQYYAAAYLGYQQIDGLDHYVEAYLYSDQLPTHYLSDGDYYLIIPRYPGMKLSLYRNDITTSQPALVFEDPDCGPFILQCNASDIFADATVCLAYQEASVSFTPFCAAETATERKC